MHDNSPEARARRLAELKEAQFNGAANGRRNQVSILPRVETPSERKAREDAERARALLASKVSVPQARPAPAPVKVRRSTLDADGTIRLMSDEECKALDAALDRARTEQALPVSNNRPGGGRKSSGRSDKAPEIRPLHDDRGYILPTGHASRPEVSDAELRFNILQGELRSEIQAGKLDVGAARKMLAAAKREAHELSREVVRCKSPINGLCDGNKFCMRCGGHGFLVIAQTEQAPSCLDTTEPEESTGYVRLLGADGLTHLDVRVTKGDPIEAAERYMVSDAHWVAARVSGPTGTPIVVATYWAATGEVERDEKGHPLRTFHATETDAAFAATVWCSHNPGTRVTTGLSRGDALMIHREKERQTRRSFSAPLQAMAEKHGPEAVPVDDPRLMSSRRDGCVVKVKPRAGMPITPGMGRALKAGRSVL